MRETDQYRIDEPRVISEFTDGELVLVHFESGCYFSVRDVGVDVFRLLSAGCTVGETIARLAAHYQRAESELAPEVSDFIRSLVEEKLLVPATNVAAEERTVELAATSYAAPSFEKFDDMADQLLLDPIHEIDETGWPARKTG